MKAKILCLILSSLALVQCDDEEKPASLEGSWQGTNAKGDVLVFGVPSGFEEEDDTFDALLEFKKDGTVKITDNSTPTDGTWAQAGNTLTTSANFDTNFIDLSGSFTIETLTEKKLVLYYEKDGTYSDPDTAIEIDGTLKATLYFDRK